ncbi:MAG: SH3 domain-containing protein, partial [Nitrospirae bacterium]|nr:SH3 domain-containing protein [Nitrospirota bacterium]
DVRREPSAISHQPQSGQYITIQVATANLRETASVDSKKAGLLVSGDNFMVQGEAVDDRGVKSYKVLHGGRERWISGEVVEVKSGK